MSASAGDCLRGKRIAIVFASFGPYHVARIDALASALRSVESECFAIRFSVDSDTYGWNPLQPKHAETVTLRSSPASSFLDAFVVGGKLFFNLLKHRIDIAYLPSFFPLPNLFCAIAAKAAGCKLVLMTESWSGTSGDGNWRVVVKRTVLRLFDSALVGGSPQARYVESLGMSADRINIGYDVVDVSHFKNASTALRRTREQDIRSRGLPPRYFLNLGRFVSKKNLLVLVRAYGRLVARRPDIAISLVFVGEGTELDSLQNEAKELGLPIRNAHLHPESPADCKEVVFFPFQQLDQTPIFYTHCEAFILPSLCEEWGLVVNEAQACGAPVVVSRQVGCAEDLVKDSCNGFVFDAEDIDELSEILEKFSCDEQLSRRMGRESSAMSESWTPTRFANASIAAASQAVSRRSETKK